MDFEPTERQVYWRDRVRDFIDRHVAPRMDDYHAEQASGDRWKVLQVIEEEKARAKAMGQSHRPEKQVRDVQLPETILVSELANRMAEKAADLVKSMFKMGMMVTVNQTIDQDTAELLVTEFGHEIKRVSEADVDIRHDEDVDDAAHLKRCAAFVLGAPCRD